MIKLLSRVIERENKGQDLVFTKGVIKCTTSKNLSGEVELCGIYKQGRSWKVVSRFNNYWTINSLPQEIQNQLFLIIFSHYHDTTFIQETVYHID